ncbi:MAG TPA: HIRAN domain-containing protein [Solirubrobacterales bacterium]|nr:HIRAN domain-containing protein [Solirubrobacterales bacterium]
MGLLSRLFNTEPRRLPQTETFEGSARITHEERIDVVGESNYQDAIREACGAGFNEDVLYECMAELIPEPSNPYDSNAVRVDIQGRCVGYLSREDAAELGQAISEGIQRQGNGMCRAVIAGRKDGDTPNLGVFLHLKVDGH